MWDVPDPVRYARALRASHRVATRLEVWSQGVPVDEASFEDFTVTDTWVTAGVRRSLSLTVEPTRAWLKYLDLPALDVRPYRGIQFSRSSSVLCPLGVFPVLAPGQGLPVSKISINADDLYQRVVRASFAVPLQTADGSLGETLVGLLNGAGLEAHVLTGAAGARVPAVLFDKGNGSRAKAIGDYAKSAGVEVWVDRLGLATVADGAGLTVPATDLFGTTRSFTTKADASKVFNQVAVSSSAQGVSFDPQRAYITDPDHPASPQRVFGYTVLDYASPLILTPDDALFAAQQILAKVSGEARTYTYACVCDARRDAGDSILGQAMKGTQISQIASVTHPSKGDQTVSTVSTQQVYT